MIGSKVPAKGSSAVVRSQNGLITSIAAVNEADLVDLVEQCDFAFQPIVNVVTGQCFGYEALLRNFERAGFSSHRHLFDTLAATGFLDLAQVRLWEKAVAKFAAVSRQGGRGARLFLNVDSRSLDGTDHLPHFIKSLLSRYNVPESAVAFEIAESPQGSFADTRQWVRPLKRNSCKIAIDRLGGASAGSLLLYSCEPDFVKIDPFFLRDVVNDSRKKLLLSHMVSVAHLLGIVVIALGVETECEFFTAKEVGCDLVQGFLVERPTFDLAAIPMVSDRVEALARNDRRSKVSDQRIILDQMEPIESLNVEAEVIAVFERLCSHTKQTFVPIVDHVGQPLGIVRESAIKNYAYSPFGKDLIANKGLGRKLKDFIVRCPVADIHMPVEDIMSIFSGDEDAEGIILVDEMRYVGFLSARSIIRVMNEKSLAMARDQNPLTKLPGNALINQFVNDSLADQAHAYVYAYVDFDNFKPFNDKYGFRQGDRAILLFAELMRKQIGQEHFLGHIGGDDFFIGFKNLTLEGAQHQVAGLLGDFRSDAESFYDAEARRQGFISALDREGKQKSFPLLSASAAVVDVPPGRNGLNVDDVSALIADLKKRAKHSSSKIACASLGEASETLLPLIAQA